jgi:hypothetical protein
MIRLPDGVLPAAKPGSLPEAPRLRRMLGPGIILLGLSIGSGEFVLWPKLTAEWGFALFWACWLGATMQFFINMEIERYTLATGESAVTGFVRLSRVWGPMFLLCGTVPWIWPGWATGAGTILAWEIGGDPVLYAVAGLLLCGAALSLSPVVYRFVEAVQVVLVALIFTGVLLLAALVVRWDSIAALVAGAFRFGYIPDGIHLPALLGALAFAGAGGTVNLAQSNYIKDKGYGMGRLVGRLTSPLTGREEAGGTIGFVFDDDDEESLARWAIWWRRANIEHFFSFYVLCMLSLALFCLLTYELIGSGAIGGGDFEFIARQGDVLAARFGPLWKHVFLGAGFAVLLSTELALLDAVTRVVTDLVKTSFLREHDGWSLSRIYLVVLWSMIGFGVLVLAVGMTRPMQLIVLSASLNAIVMFLYSGLLLWLNLRSFGPPLRPSALRILAMLGAFGFFGYFSIVTAIEELPKLLG